MVLGTSGISLVICFSCGEVIRCVLLKVRAHDFGFFSETNERTWKNKK